MLVNTLLLPLWLLQSVLRIRREKAHWHFVAERFGFFRPSQSHFSAWVHCASVGEYYAAKPILARLSKPALLSVSTASAWKLARAENPSLVVRALPIDHPFCLWLPPRCTLGLWVIETEIWPLLYRHCQHMGVQIINGRLSDKTRAARGVVRQLLTDALQHTPMVYCRSVDDEQAYRALGAPHTQVLPSLKWAIPETTRLPAAITVLAASTHAYEEPLLIAAWKQLAKPGERLVIAPRHPHRCPEVLAQLQNTPHTLITHLDQLGRLNQQESAQGIVVVQAFGMMSELMRRSQVVVMGGSFRDGGHNPIEAIAAGAALVVGPDMRDFLEETALLHDVITQASNAHEALQHALGHARLPRSDAPRAQILLRDQKKQLNGALDALFATSSG